MNDNTTKLHPITVEEQLRNQLQVLVLKYSVAVKALQDIENSIYKHQLGWTIANQSLEILNEPKIQE